MRSVWMTKREYIFAHLRRLKGKQDENYVITRIVHQLDDLEIKFVTQQHVRRADGKRALTDLFFPQFDLHVEVKEHYHDKKEQIKLDAAREAAIIDATKHKFKDVCTGKDNETIESINEQITRVVDSIKLLKCQKEDAGKFIPWDIDAEYNPQTYIDRGEIEVGDDVALKTIYDVCNCFGHEMTCRRVAGAPHPEEGTYIWCPKLYPNGMWENELFPDEMRIVEKHSDEEKRTLHVEKHLRGSKRGVNKRIVFAHSKDRLGFTLYRFKGLFELNELESSPSNGLIWDRIRDSVETFPSGHYKKVRGK